MGGLPYLNHINHLWQHAINSSSAEVWLSLKATCLKHSLTVKEEEGRWTIYRLTQEKKSDASLSAPATHPNSQILPHLPSHLPKVRTPQIGKFGSASNHEILPETWSYNDILLWSHVAVWELSDSSEIKQYHSAGHKNKCCYLGEGGIGYKTACTNLDYMSPANSPCSFKIQQLHIHLQNEPSNSANTTASQSFWEGHANFSGISLRTTLGYYKYCQQHFQKSLVYLNISLSPCLCWRHHSEADFLKVHHSALFGNALPFKCSHLGTHYQTCKKPLLYHCHKD